MFRLETTSESVDGGNRSCTTYIHCFEYTSKSKQQPAPQKTLMTDLLGRCKIYVKETILTRCLKGSGSILPDLRLESNSNPT